MKYFAAFFLLFLLLNKPSAQTTFSGIITDSLRNPVPFASIYLNNTTAGTYTDNNGGYTLTILREGAYDLVVSCVGYMQKSVMVKADNNHHNINLQLAIKPVDLEEVVVEKKSTNRLKDYAFFSILLFGNSKFSKQCLIRNPNDLRLYGQFLGSIKRGYSVKPLEIVNRALGYRIVFELTDFSYDQSTQVIKFSGPQYFIPMNGSKHQQKKWEENRKAAYYGSYMHFFRKLYSDSAANYNFGIYEYPEKQHTTGEYDGNPIEGSQLVIKSEMDYREIFYDKDISVVFSKTVGKKIKGKVTVMTTTEKSFLRFSDTVQLYRNGFYFHPYSISLGGRMGDPRMAEMLPYDYMPEDYGENSVSPVQNSLSDSINRYLVTPYNNYFSTAREQVYTHFNKSSYLPGDEIWFKNYLINPATGLPCDSSRILYTELYAPDGKLLGSKILELQGGTAFSSFKLSDNTLPGKYTFRAYTSWMKNFQSANDFTSYLDVLGVQREEDSAPQSGFDIQFLPESGTLLAGTWNRIGVKALDRNGKGISLKGEVLNGKRVKTTFELNKFGMGEFRILPKTDSLYYARIFLPDGKEQILSLPAVEPKGVIIEVGDRFRDKIAVAIKTNPLTIGDTEIYHLLVHNEGNFINPATIELSKDKPDISFTIKNDDISNGVNYITVFNRNFEPVAEKAFFRLKENILGKIDIEQSFVNDSIEFTISSSDSLTSPVAANLSMSVLPGGTVSDRFYTSLYCEALLRPGLTGNIESPAYYLENDDREHHRDLDLLFLTQGWRKYDWKNIAQDSSKTKCPFETAFSIFGKVEGKEKTQKDYVVSLMSPDNNLLLLKNVNSDGNFMFSNLALLDKTAVNIAVSDNAGKTRNLKVNAQIYPAYRPDTIIPIKPVYKSLFKPDNSNSDIKLLPQEILLKDVVVTAKARKRPFDGALYQSSFDKVFEITKESHFKYESIERLLLHEFNVAIRYENGNYEIDMQTQRNSGPVSLIIDDLKQSDYSMLQFMNPTILEAVSVVKTGNALFGENGAIIIKTRKEPLDWGFEDAPNSKTIQTRGFSQPAKYYSPRYLYPPDTEPFQKHATIFWKPDIVTFHEGKATFRFAIPKGMKEIKVRTEGFSENGTIFLDNRRIQTTN